MNKKVVLPIVVILIIGAISYLELTKTEVEAPVIEVNKNIELDQNALAKARIALKKKQFDSAKEITTPDHFINTEPVKVSDLIGKKVILIDFWTYSCINCQRTLPYLKEWHRKYADQGLVILGLHTPEFEFEKSIENVEDAVKRFGIEYPVIMDNDFSTWRAYKNLYWPRKYIIDIDGFVVYDHIGEGGYEETEKKIQKLLEERQKVLGEEKEVTKEITKEEKEDSRVKSPEVYFGAWRNDLLANGIQREEGVQKFEVPDQTEKNQLYLDGEWDIKREFAKNLKPGDKVVFNYEAQNVFFVGSAEKEVRVKIMRDGKPIGMAAGADVDDDGFVIVKEERLYKIIEDKQASGEHKLEMTVEGAGLELFTFTFG